MVLSQVVDNWDGLKSVFKYIDRNGCATITIAEMKVRIGFGLVRRSNEHVF